MKQLEAKFQLDSIYQATSDVVFSKNMASQIVGGRTKLEDLVAEGKIRAVKVNAHQHGKWMCNASDVLRYVVPLY